MIPVLTRAQMRAFDRYAIETCHVPGIVLMENAGRGAADVISAMLEARRVPRAGVLLAPPPLPDDTAPTGTLTMRHESFKLATMVLSWSMPGRVRSLKPFSRPFEKSLPDLSVT